MGTTAPPFRFRPNWALNHPPIDEGVERSIMRILACPNPDCHHSPDCTRIAKQLRDWYRWYHAQHPDQIVAARSRLAVVSEVGDEEDGFCD